MLNSRDIFYKNNIEKFIINKNSSILICGGGILDKTLFEQSGYTNVIISNVDKRDNIDLFLPYQWKYENAENLSFNDNHFDYVVVHAAIHHSSSPHKMLTEMYRVAKKGLLAIESRDSFLMRLLEKLNVIQVYEHAAVYYNNCYFGGVNNTEIPNYIYRWTEREIEKTINSYNPFTQNKIFYEYGTSFPCTPQLEKKGYIKYLLLKLIQPVYFLFKLFFKKQQNMFAFYIEKANIPDNIHSWLKYNKENNIVTFNKDWANNKYKIK